MRRARPLPTLENRIIRQPPDVCKLGHDTVDKSHVDKRASRLRLKNCVLGRLAVESILDIEPCRTEAL